MGESFPPRQKYGDADGYDSYMGEWSAALSPGFLQFAEMGGLGRVLDIGCGTGNLLAALATDYPNAALTGVDPSAVLLYKARRRPELASVTLVEGTVERLPFESGTFDHCLSLLVLQEFSDRLLALAEMLRVTRRGGTVAACQWDFARMPVIAALVEAIREVNPRAGDDVASGSPSGFADETELLRYWTKAGFKKPLAGRVVVARRFSSWTPAKSLAVVLMS